MKWSLLRYYLWACLVIAPLGVALAAAPTATPPPKKPETKKAETKKPETKKPEDQKKDEKSPTANLLGTDTKSNEPTTTEIYSDEAFFDSNKSMGIFTGHVKVIDPRFNLQSEKLTVFITKGENQGLERAIAEGNVGVVRDKPDPNGGPPTRAVGRAETATYVAATGDVELKGTPRVQQGENTHIATSPDTVMLINQNGQLTTHGPSRTEIKQQPKDEDEENAKDEKGDKKETGKGEKKDKGKGEKKTENKTEAKPTASPKS